MNSIDRTRIEEYSDRSIDYVICFGYLNPENTASGFKHLKLLSVKWNTKDTSWLLPIYIDTFDLTKYNYKVYSELSTVDFLYTYGILSLGWGDDKTIELIIFKPIE